jgi:diacylglycerol kinase family enzyme
VVIIPAGSRIGLVKRAWGLRTKRLERQRKVVHHEGKVVSVTLPASTEINVDGEFRDSGMESVTARAAAFELVVPTSR